jgi:hypothetical protein
MGNCISHGDEKCADRKLPTIVEYNMYIYVLYVHEIPCIRALDTYSPIYRVAAFASVHARIWQCMRGTWQVMRYVYVTPVTHTAGGVLRICHTLHSHGGRCATYISHSSLTRQAVRYVYSTPVTHTARRQAVRYVYGMPVTQQRRLGPKCRGHEAPIWLLNVKNCSVGRHKHFYLWLWFFEKRARGPRAAYLRLTLRAEGLQRSAIGRSERSHMRQRDGHRCARHRVAPRRLRWRSR